MENQNPTETEVEIIIAFLKANLKVGTPTIKEIIEYLKRKYKITEKEKIVDPDRKEQRY